MVEQAEARFTGRTEKQGIGSIFTRSKQSTLTGFCSHARCAQQVYVSEVKKQVDAAIQLSRGMEVCEVGDDLLIVSEHGHNSSVNLAERTCSSDKIPQLNQMPCPHFIAAALHQSELDSRAHAQRFPATSVFVPRPLWQRAVGNCFHVSTWVQEYRSRIIPVMEDTLRKDGTTLPSALLPVKKGRPALKRIRSLGEEGTAGRSAAVRQRKRSYGAIAEDSSDVFNQPVTTTSIPRMSAPFTDVDGAPILRRPLLPPAPSSASYAAAPSSASYAAAASAEAGAAATAGLAAGSGGRTARFACTQCQKGFTSHKGLLYHHTMNVCTRRPRREAEATAGVPAPSSTASSAAAPAVVVNGAAPAAGLAAPAAGLTAPATAGVPAPSSTASSAAAPAVVVNEAAPAAGLAAPATAARSSVRLRSQQAKK